MKNKLKTLHDNSSTSSWTLYQADVIEALRKLKDDSVHCVVTSPPYWGLRAYPIRPSIWLGGKNCKHSCGRPRRKKGIQGGHNQGDRANHPQGSVCWPTPDTHSRLCRACGAWKVGHGRTQAIDPRSMLSDLGFDARGNCVIQLHFKRFGVFGDECFVRRRSLTGRDQ